MYGNFAGVDLICSLMHQRHVSVVRWFAHALHASIDTLQLILLLTKKRNRNHIYKYQTGTDEHACACKSVVGVAYTHRRRSSSEISVGTNERTRFSGIIHSKLIKTTSEANTHLSCTSISLLRRIL
jgi:hypothetical protein